MLETTSNNVYDLTWQPGSLAPVRVLIAEATDLNNVISMLLPDGRVMVTNAEGTFQALSRTPWTASSWEVA